MANLIGLVQVDVRRADCGVGKRAVLVEGALLADLGPDDVGVHAVLEVVVRDTGEAYTRVHVAIRGLRGARVPMHAVAGDAVAGVADVGGGAVAADSGGAGLRDLGVGHAVAGGQRGVGRRSDIVTAVSAA